MPTVDTDAFADVVKRLESLEACDVTAALEEAREALRREREDHAITRRMRDSYQSRFQLASQEIAELKTVVAAFENSRTYLELTDDKARIDWLESQPPDDCFDELSLRASGRGIPGAHSVRTAIDALRNEAK